MALSALQAKDGAPDEVPGISRSPICSADAAAVQGQSCRKSSANSPGAMPHPGERLLVRHMGLNASKQDCRERPPRELERLWSHPGRLEHYLNTKAATKDEEVVKRIRRILYDVNYEVCPKPIASATRISTCGMVDGNRAWVKHPSYP